MTPHPSQTQTMPAAEERSPSDGRTLDLDAVYEDGAFRPLAPIDLPAGARVRLRVDAAAPPAAAQAESGLRAGLLPLLLTLGAALLAGLAQQQFIERGEFAWAPFGMAALAALATGWLYHGREVWLLRGGPPPEARRATTAPPLATWRSGLLVAAAALIAVVLAALATDGHREARPDMNWAFFPWLAALACFVLAVAPPPRDWRLPRPGRRTLLTLAALGVAALALRVWQLGAVPATVGGDEGSQGLEAVAVLQGALRNPFSTGWLGVPTMSFYFNAPTIALLGPTATALRLPWVLVGVATVLVTYLLAARLHGKGIALLTAALLAGYHYHIHYSRLGSNQIADGLIAALTLLCLYRAYDRRSPVDWALCGVVIGVAQFFYAGARFSAVLAAAVVALLALRDGRRFWREQGWGVAILVAAALLAAAPMIQYALRFPADYNARLNQVGIFQSGWLEREQPIRGQGPLPILLDQFLRAALAYNAYPDRTVWYGSRAPLFDVAYGALFIVGLGFAGLRLLDRRLFPMVAWWGGAIIMGGMLTESPPSSQRLVTTAIPAIFFVALGLALLAQGVGRALGAKGPRALAPALAVAVAALTFTSVRYYFVEYTPLRTYGSTNAIVATDLAAYANRRLGPGARVVFFGWPRMSVNFGTFPFLAPEVERVDVMDPLALPPAPDLAPPGKLTAFVFVPEREPELAFVQQTFPGGQLERIPSPVEGGDLYVVYLVKDEG
jgi:hypothetical protein